MAKVLDTGCCKRFDPKPWDGKTIVLKDRLFVKVRVLSFLHIPLNYGQVMASSMEKIWAAKAAADSPLMLSDENSLWGADVYIAVSKKVAGLENVRLSGTFLSKVFEGDYKNMGTWIKQMNDYVASKGKTTEKLYFFYTMCPACAKAYGQNYTVLLAKIV
ncbi:MAG: hydrolase [Candidatus Micrarchaeia archaeon]